MLTLRHRQSENGTVTTMMTYDSIVSRKPQKLFSMTAALSVYIQPASATHAYASPHHRISRLRKFASDEAIQRVHGAN